MENPGTELEMALFPGFCVLCSNNSISELGNRVFIIMIAGLAEKLAINWR